MDNLIAIVIGLVVCGAASVGAGIDFVAFTYGYPLKRAYRELFPKRDR